MYFRVILISLLLLMEMPVLGVPAFPSKVKVLTEDGDSVTILIRGDENHKFGYTEDGFVIMPLEKGWSYLTENPKEGVGLTYLPLCRKAKDKYGITSEKFLTSINWEACKKTINKTLDREMYKSPIPMIGEHHVLVILMEFTDKEFIKTQDDFNALFNTIGYSEGNAKGSVRDYYRYASYNQFDLIGDIYGPYVSKSSMATYGHNNSFGNDSDPLSLAIEAIQSLPEDIDLSLYDNDDDGTVDNVHIIFAGYGEEAGGGGDAIWSHEYPHRLPIEINGYKFAGYSCTPELRSNMGWGISRIGVICHELGHAFGANDFYDVDYESNGSYEGTGEWDLMASGSWNGSGASPANINPYVKINNFGWIMPSIPEESSYITLNPSNYEPEVLRMDTSYPDDYYLCEYRTKVDFDSELPGEGLLIYHVHPQIDRYVDTNSLNSTHPQCFYLVDAGCQSNPFLTKDYGSINTERAPFPGATNNTEFSANTMPCPFQWNGEMAGFGLSEIRENVNSCSFEFFTSVDTLTIPEIISSYYEGFENGISEFNIESISGNAQWTLYPSGSTIFMNDLPIPVEGEKAIMLYVDQKASTESKSILTSPKVTLSPDSVYSFSFYLKTKEKVYTSSHNLLLEVKASSSNSWQPLVDITDKVEQWTEYEVELPGGIQHLYYRFEGTIFGDGLFLDNIRIKNTGNVNSISSPLYGEEGSQIQYFNLQGIQVNNLLPGNVYIKIDGTKRQKIYLK